MDMERRGLSGIVTLRGEAKAQRVSGYAAMYHRETIIMGLWREQVAPGAFATALSGEDDVRALFNHDPNILLGRTKSGTLTLSDDEDGLRYDIALPETQQARDVRELIQRGDVSGSSFGFTITEEDWDDSPTKRGQLPLLTILKVELFDVSPVTFPAYPQTSVTARSRGEALRADVQAFQKRRHDVALRERIRLRVQIERAKAWAS